MSKEGGFKEPTPVSHINKILVRSSIYDLMTRAHAPPSSTGPETDPGHPPIPLARSQQKVTQWAVF